VKEEVHRRRKRGSPLVFLEKVEKVASQLEILRIDNLSEEERERLTVTVLHMKRIAGQTAQRLLGGEME